MNISRDRDDESPRPIATAHPIGKLMRYLERQSASGFFGRVTVSFQNGKVCNVQIEQSKKLDEL
jgi:hypothetical protein